MPVVYRRLTVPERAVVDEYAQQAIACYPDESASEQYHAACRALARSDEPYSFAAIATCIVKHRGWGKRWSVALLEPGSVEGPAK